MAANCKVDFCANRLRLLARSKRNRQYFTSMLRHRNARVNYHGCGRILVVLE
jgi:hypothetical protein